MKGPIQDRGKNITSLQPNLLKVMDGADATQLVTRALELIKKLPDPGDTEPASEGLMLGLVQSGKTYGLTTVMALSSDNGYRCFIVLTSDSQWLHDQTIKRLRQDLPRMQIQGKGDWESNEAIMPTSLRQDQYGLVLVTTKNAQVLQRLGDLLDKLKDRCEGQLPATLIIDDEADQASLDTQASKRAKNPSVSPGRISDLIMAVRGKLSRYTFLQVTATPQALFLQNMKSEFRPKFTVLFEPGKGYVGGDTFFSIIGNPNSEIIRYISDKDITDMLNSNNQYIPDSFKKATCIFFVGAAIRYIQNTNPTSATNNQLNRDELFASFLCHVSKKTQEHSKVYQTILKYYDSLRVAINSLNQQTLSNPPIQDLQDAYNDLLQTLPNTAPQFDAILSELELSINNTEIQILNSDRDQDEPSYTCRYNIIIGGNKLARGVTIKNLLVTYYGRQTKKANMDTMLQHARMYGYRQRDLAVTRLFVTSDVEERFRLIEESEQALRELIRKHPDEEYRAIPIGKDVRATRRNVLTLSNIGAYAAGKNYFPRKSLYQGPQVQKATKQLDRILDQLYPSNKEKNPGTAVQITVDKIIELIKITKSDPNRSGSWNDKRIIAALESLKKLLKDDTAFLVVRRDRKRTPQGGNKMEIRAFFGGAEAGEEGDERYARKDYPTLFMYRIREKEWANIPFWVPNVRFPDGTYALTFNFE